MSFFRTITLIDVLDVVVLAMVFYQVLLIFQRTRASQLILGFLYFLILFIIAYVLNMTATLWVFEKLAGLLAIALLIIFQPELRNFFERAGRRRLLLGPIGVPEREDVEILLDTVIQALDEMSEDHTGALIVLEREISVDEYISTGERIDAVVRKDLLKAIFHKGNPLHDGAVVIRKGRIASARSFLPLSDSRDIPSYLGTRHRAALGITEASDAISLVVSEETGHLSFFHAGKATVRLTPKILRLMTRGILIRETNGELPQSRLGILFGRLLKSSHKESDELTQNDTTISEEPLEDDIGEGTDANRTDIDTDEGESSK